MFLHKNHHPANFVFFRTGTSARAALQVDDLGEDTYWIHRRRGFRRESQAELHRLSSVSSKGAARLRFSSRGQLSWAGLALSFGTSGAAWMLRFDAPESTKFYGLGEKWGPLEKSGHRSQFYNTDVWADYATEAIARAEVSSPYASIPFLILETGTGYLGVLIDSPFPSFVSLGAQYSISGDDQQTKAKRARTIEAKEHSQDVFLGASEGDISLLLFRSDSILELASRLQRVLGTTPRPPLWALGHHQCRWGYESDRDLLALDQAFVAHKIPCDGLWLDIDYMRGYRVFSVEPRHFRGAPARDQVSPLPALQELRARGRRIVPILDPGVKADPAYRVTRRGLAGGHFCLSPSGRPYQGVVWPGLSYFPDFSLESVREFWAREVERFTRFGFDGYWIDMNDPATGPIEHDSMLFDRGRKSHTAFHNQYAWGMAKATHDGLGRAYPDRRPFVLSRSGSPGIARFAALWTGDNLSSFEHLARSIPIGLNLSLSGVPFQGADVPGFGGDASGELSVRWYQAAFLSPFLRNHSIRTASPQEPWAYGPRYTKILRKFIELRYRFLPYLYQQFVQQEREGTPIQRPLVDDTGRLFPCADTQFTTGDRLIHCPSTDAAGQVSLSLPQGSYFCLQTGRWLRGGKARILSVPLGETPLLVKERTILALARLAQVRKWGYAHPDLLSALELHIFLEKDGQAITEIFIDDGETLAYRRTGEEGVLRVIAERQGASLGLAVEARGRFPRALGSSLSLEILEHGGAEWLSFAGQSRRLIQTRVEFSGRRFAARKTRIRVELPRADEAQ